jgi:hypothetical protein
MARAYGSAFRLLLKGAWGAWGGVLECGLAEDFFGGERGICRGRLDQSGAFKRLHRRGIARYPSRQDRLFCGQFGSFSFRRVGYSVGKECYAKEKGPTITRKPLI